MRGWTFINDDPPGDHFDENGDLTPKGKIREEMIQKLTSEWNEIHTQIEQRSFRSDEDRDAEDDYWACRAEEVEDEAITEALEKNPLLSKEERRAIAEAALENLYKERSDMEMENHFRIDVLEELLSDLGVRMMRPYEHWNEDERLMEYLENRYDDGY